MDTDDKPADLAAAPVTQSADHPISPQSVPEINGRDGPEPTRYGDWEKHGRCIDF